MFVVLTDGVAAIFLEAAQDPLITSRCRRLSLSYPYFGSCLHLSRHDIVGGREDLLALLLDMSTYPISLSHITGSPAYSPYPLPILFAFGVA